MIAVKQPFKVAKHLPALYSLHFRALSCGLIAPSNRVGRGAFVYSTQNHKWGFYLFISVFFFYDTRSAASGELPESGNLHAHHPARPPVGLRSLTPTEAASQADRNGRKCFEFRVGAGSSRFFPLSGSSTDVNILI